MLVLQRRLGESIVIGEGPDMITVEVVELHGGRLKLGINAPSDVKVDRKEVRESKEDRLFAERCAADAERNL